MGIVPMVRESIDAVNHNWQLVMMQLLFILATIGCFIFFIIIPVGIAFVFFGIDLTALFEARELSDVLFAFHQTSGLLTKYIGVAVMVMFGLLLYLTSFVALSVINFGGTVGILTRYLLGRISRFSFHEFLSEGKHLFGSIFIYANLLGVMIFIPLFFLGIVRDGATLLTELAARQDITFAHFLNTFFGLLLLCTGLFILLSFGAMAFYGFAEIAKNHSRPVRTMGVVFHYLVSRPSAFGYFTIVAAGFLALLAVLFLIVYAFSYVPLIGSLLSVAVYHVGMAYLSVLLFAIVCQYYIRHADDESETQSTPQNDISSQPENGHVQTPLETAEPPQTES
jgi:hypothetical protein